MMSRMLGAPLGGTTRGGHQGVESLALSLIVPPNAGGGGGSCDPSTVVVALGVPATPVTTWAEASPIQDVMTASIAEKRKIWRAFIFSYLLSDYGGSGASSWPIEIPRT